MTQLAVKASFDWGLPNFMPLMGYIASHSRGIGAIVPPQLKGGIERLELSKVLDHRRTSDVFAHEDDQAESPLGCRFQIDGLRRAVEATSEPAFQGLECDRNGPLIRPRSVRERRDRHVQRPSSQAMSLPAAVSPRQPLHPTMCTVSAKMAADSEVGSNSTHTASLHANLR